MLRNYNHFYAHSPISRGSNLIGQRNIIKWWKFSFFIFCWESFAGNDCLNSGTHGHHQRLGFLFCDALPVLEADFSCCLFVGLSASSFVFSKWNAYSIGLKSDNWLGHYRIFHFFAFKNSCVAFAVYFGSLSSCTMKRRPINFVAFGRIWAESISLYTRILPAASFLCHVITKQTPETHCYWKPYTLLQSHCSTIFHRWCCMLWIMSCSKPSPYFFSSHRSGTQVDLNFIRPKNVFSEVVWLFLGVFWQSLIWPCLHCGEPSLFALVKSSLDCRHWQWHIYLLESVLLLVGCYERGFLYHGEDPTIIHHCCPLWTSRPFYVAELNSAFFFPQNVPNCWFGNS